MYDLDLIICVADFISSHIYVFLFACQMHGIQLFALFYIFAVPVHWTTVISGSSLTIWLQWQTTSWLHHTRLAHRHKCARTRTTRLSPRTCRATAPTW